MLASLVVALALPGASPAVEKPTPAEVQQLIEQMGSSSFERREEASGRLREMGTDALSALLVAAWTHPDLEVQVRAARLLHGLKGRYRSAEAFADSVAEVIGIANKDMLPEVAPEQLTRLAVGELFALRGRKVPADLAQRLSQARELTAEQVRGLLCAGHVRAEPAGDPETVRNQVLRRMLQAVDPYADWITSPHRMSGEYRPCGVGLRLRTDPDSRLVRVITPIRNSPADRAGIRAGDLLTEIIITEDRDDASLPAPEVISTRDLTAAEVSKKILGRSKTWITLSIRRGNDPVRTLRVRREHVIPETVIGWRQKGQDGWDYWLDPDRHIAYVRLTAFGRETAQDLKTVLAGLERQGMRGLVLDLRFNLGGLCSSAVEIADLFIGDGLICRIWARTEEARFDGKREGSRLGFPLACLINGDSKASAEIVAACLQDHKRAAIIGERSRGYARVQNVLRVEKSERCQLQLTVAVFLRPSGRKLDRMRLAGRTDDEWGVTPDRGQAVTLPAVERERLEEYLDSRDWILRRDQVDEMRHFRDRQREQALAYLRSQITDVSVPKR